MKQLSKVSWAALFFVFACETEVVNEAGFVYNTNQQVVSTTTFLIDFETYNSGDVVSEIILEDPFDNLLVSGITMAFPDTNSAMIFDSSNPTGGDFDLGTPNEMYGGPGKGNGGESNDTALGNVLILSEDLDSSDPDDIFEIGASFRFDFPTDEIVILKSFDILDIEESNNATVVHLYDSKGLVLLTKEISPGGDNSKVKVDLENTANVATLELLMNSSGALDNLEFDMETEAACTDCDSAIAQLEFQYNGSNSEAQIRVESNGEILFDDLVEMDAEFSVSGTNEDGSFPGSLILFVNDEAAGTIQTDCSQVVGPGLLIGAIEVISGRTTLGGVLCPIQIAF